MNKATLEYFVVYIQLVDGLVCGSGYIQARATNNARRSFGIGGRTK